MGTSTGHSSTTKGGLGEGGAPAKKRVTLRRKAAKKASSTHIATTAETSSSSVAPASSAGRPADLSMTTSTSAGQQMSREDRKKLIAAARAQGLLPLSSASARKPGGAVQGAAPSGVKLGKMARAPNPNSRRRLRGAKARRAVVAGANEEEPGAAVHMTAAEQRMSEVHDELVHFDAVVQADDFTADPFAAVSRHLTETMSTLKPLTPDVGRLPEAE